jgi:hypothetical protein
MELSIRRSTAFFICAAVGVGWYVTRGGGDAHLPAPAKEALDAVREQAPAPSAPPPRRAPAPPAQAPAPATPATPAPPAPPSAPENPPAKHERTPDEKATSALALAQGYADNGRFDRAFETLEQAAALHPSAAVQAELDAATARIDAQMRAQRR